MGHLIQNKDDKGNKLYPITVTDAVVDKDGVTLTEILENGIGGGSIDPELSETSTNAIQNKAVAEALNSKADISYVDEAIPDMEGVVKAVDTSETIEDAEFKGCVQYDFQQALTSEQKQQARTNIGVDEAIASAVTKVLNNPV